MSRLKVGDTVKIKSNLEAYEYYGTEVVTSEMKYRAGWTATIAKVLGNTYQLDIDDDSYYWTSEMFNCWTEEMFDLTEEQIEQIT